MVDDNDDGDRRRRRRKPRDTKKKSASDLSVFYLYITIKERAVERPKTTVTALIFTINDTLRILYTYTDCWLASRFRGAAAITPIPAASSQKKNHPPITLYSIHFWQKHPRKRENDCACDAAWIVAIT